MRITREADYAIRIVYALKVAGKTISARQISETSGVTLRFALKILRKLSMEGIVESQKGAAGGYCLAVQPEDLSLGQVIECIDGPLEISQCLDDTFDCTRVQNKASCQFRRVYGDISRKVKEDLYSIKLSQFN